MKKGILFTVIAVAVVLFYSACSIRQPLADMFAQPFQAVLDQQRGDMRVPGLVAAVILPDGTIWQGVSGKSSDEQAMRQDMLFGLASITKTYIAALVVQLADTGYLSLKDGVGNWLPGPTWAHDLTIHQLLSHTSGLYRFQQKAEFLAAVYAHPEKEWTPEEIITQFLGPRECPAGTCFGESAMDYVLMGMIIEKATGTPLPTLLKNRLFVPLELENTFLYPQQLYPKARMAHMWWDFGTGELEDVCLEAGEKPLAGLFSALWASGAMHATAADLARFAHGLFQKHILTNPQRNTLLAATTKLGDTIHYGYSVVVEEIQGQPAYWHTGGAGYASIYLHMPMENLTIVVLCNLMIDAKPIALALYRAYAAGHKPGD